MGKALVATRGVKLANFAGGAIPEKEKLPTEKLSFAKDFHFGVSHDLGETKGPTVLKNKKDGSPQKWGVRQIDMDKRGGQVAEQLWSLRNITSLPANLQKTLDDFTRRMNQIGKNKKIQDGKDKFKAGAKATVSDGAKPDGELSVVPMEGAKYIDPHGTKESSNIAGPHQLGARWSKAAIQIAVESGYTVHFHLDGMGDINQIIHNNGDASHNTTSRELRFIYRNWNAKEFQDHVRFYNGFTETEQVVEVECPWNGHVCGASCKLPSNS